MRCLLVGLIMGLVLAGNGYGQAQDPASFSSGLMKVGVAQTWWYQTADNPSKQFGVQWDPNQGTFEVFEPNTMAKPMIWGRFSANGQLTEFTTYTRTLRYSREGRRFRTDYIFAGKNLRQSLSDEVVLDSNFSCFAVGFYPLNKLGDEVSIRIAAPQESNRGPETAEYEAFFKVVGFEDYRTSAGVFQCIKVDFGFKGIIAAFAPRLVVWVDLGSRRTVAFKGNGNDSNSQKRELIRIGP
jgi:hypothetical protein